MSSRTDGHLLLLALPQLLRLRRKLWQHSAALQAAAAAACCMVAVQQALKQLLLLLALQHVSLPSLLVLAAAAK
jgi:hypothetical protein